MDMSWSDRKRHLGLPISFTKYSLNDTRIFCESGLLNLKEEEVLLYRVRDISMKRSFWQRIFRVGTVCLISSDKTAPHLDLVNIRNPREVKEQIFNAVEAAKEARRMHPTELLSDNDIHGDLCDADDIDDLN